MGSREILVEEVHGKKDRMAFIKLPFQFPQSPAIGARTAAS